MPVIINNKKKCRNYDFLYKSLDETYSVSIINENGTLISSYNDKILRIPASNLKLFSTAYLLNKYKSSKNFKTSIFRRNSNKYYLLGSGDPDLSYSDIYKLLSNISYNKKINLNIFEINSKYYWPKGWTSGDKKFEYGAPITTLALNSNQSKYENIETLKRSIEKYLFNKYPSSSIKVKIVENSKKFYMKPSIELDSIRSNPLLSLITLANSESHNFTSESLFKNASNTWNDNNYFKLKNWLRNIGLNVANSSFADASGLSRNNRVNTKLIAEFLNKMKYSKDFSTYQSSLSIIGVRGTLAKRYSNSELQGKFVGKTGTLSNVFALSGYLFKDNKSFVVSIIQNSENIDRDTTFNLLKNIYKLEGCF
ncbi:D-alanyl-D-alanine carboxypeptidase [Prochlorococcus marinus]|uniref:D-alanyl-D-alanine carboxypeptidase n=1 Tax=Prochlorococcus marinus TaxID=1219 RepID=UPI001CED68AF|nr:D-alanyl-D-alanine carboxypeptidase [Prochlorococcus marinus]